MIGGKGNWIFIFNYVNQTQSEQLVFPIIVLNTIITIMNLELHVCKPCATISLFSYNNGGFP